MGRRVRALPPRRHWNLDWILVAVALIAVTLVVGTVIRIDTPETGTSLHSGTGSLQALSDREALVAFEDYTFDTGGWTDVRLNDTEPGLGSVVIPEDMSAPLNREFSLPPETARATLRFDLVGRAEDGFDTIDVVVMGYPVLRRVDGGEASLPQIQEASVDLSGGAGLVARAERTDSVNPQTWAVMRIEAVVDYPEDPLTLELAPTPDATGPRIWAVDNLSLVTETAP